MTRKIKPYKGGRDDRIYARISKQAKVKLLARVKHEGYKSLGDWLEAQAMAQPTQRVPDAVYCTGCGDELIPLCPECSGEE